MVTGSAAIGGVPPVRIRAGKALGSEQRWQGGGVKCGLLESGLLSMPSALGWLFKGVWKCLRNGNGLAQVPGGNLSHLSLGLNFHEYYLVSSLLGLLG